MIQNVSGEFHLKLAELGSKDWNRWAITVISEENLKKVDEKFKGIAKNSEEELKNLYARLGLQVNQTLNVNINLSKFKDLSCNFKGFLFPDNAFFSEAQFSGNADFKKAQFNQMVKFENVTFESIPTF